MRANKFVSLRIFISFFQFSFESCKFKVQRNKEGTGRIVVWMLGVTNSYTMEASFGGSSLGGRAMTHFSTAVRKTVIPIFNSDITMESPLLTLKSYLLFLCFRILSRLVEHFVKHFWTFRMRTQTK